MKAKRIGNFNKRVTIQRYTENQDSYGEPIKTWEDIITIWAEVLPLSGREYFAAQQAQAEVSHRITTRYIGGLYKEWVYVSPETMMPVDEPEYINRPHWRIVLGTRILEIESVIDIEERHRYLEFMCKEAVS